MPDLKSQHATSLELEVVVSLLKDIRGVTSRDVATLVRRFNNEGLAFLTKTLPTLGKAFDQGLVTERFSPPTNFKRRSRNGSAIPAFCGSLLCKVFSNDGQLLTEPCPLAIQHVRQLCFLFYKLELEYSDALKDACIDGFVETEEVVLENLDSIPKSLLSKCQQLTTDVFHDLDIEGFKSGPGSTADLPLEMKTELRPSHGVPACEFFGISSFYSVNSLEWLWRAHWFAVWIYAMIVSFDIETSILSCDLTNKPVPLATKVTTVPKDSRGPRIISVEPAIQMWYQQGVMSSLVKRMENHRLTSGNVNFTDQSINQDIALKGSIDKSWSTLDLKEASDRVPLVLVEHMFSGCIDTLNAMKACRTEFADYSKSDGLTRRVKFKKWAPMGSATCFPILAWVTYCLLVVDYAAYYRLSISESCAMVKVFGDDVCVPTHYAYRASEVLESAGLLVNKAKSCVNSHFLESCGMDAWKGFPVAPIRAKKFHRLKSQTMWFEGSTPFSMASLASSLLAKGYPTAAGVVINNIEEVYGPLPRSKVDVGFLHLRTSFDEFPNVRVIKKFGRQCRVIKGYCLQPEKATFSETYHGRLLRVLRVAGMDVEIPPIGSVVVPRSISLRKKTFIVD